MPKKALAVVLVIVFAMFCCVRIVDSTENGLQANREGDLKENGCKLAAPQGDNADLIFQMIGIWRVISIYENDPAINGWAGYYFGDYDHFIRIFAHENRISAAVIDEASFGTDGKIMADIFMQDGAIHWFQQQGWPYTTTVQPLFEGSKLTLYFTNSARPGVLSSIKTMERLE